MSARSCLQWLAERWRQAVSSADRLLRWFWPPAEWDDEPGGEPAEGIERPWLVEPWRVPSVRRGFGSAALAHARSRGVEVARLTLGEEIWNQLRSQGYLDVRSTHIPGLTYRLRVGRRVQLLWATPEAARRMRWPYRGYLCINPTYPLPAVEFAAHLYLYLRDQEEVVIRVAAPQAADDLIRHVF
jgi:hypothetical protein